MFDSMTGYYDYDKLISAVKDDENEDTLMALGQWFEAHGDRFWNGESFDCDDLGRLFPVQREVSEDQWETVGYELK